MSSRNKHEQHTSDVYDNENDTFPRSSSVSGTITTEDRGNIVIGSSTSFTSDFQVGDYIYVSSQHEIRAIERIVDDTELHIEAPFSSNLSGASFSKVKSSPYTEISILVDSSGTAKIDNVEKPADSSLTFGNVTDHGRGINRQRPIEVDTTSNSNKVYVTAKV